MDDELRLLTDVFPDVPPPDERAWRLVTDRIAVAMAIEAGGDDRRARQRRRRRTVMWSAAAVSAAAALVVSVLVTGSAPRPPATNNAWRLVSAVGTAFQTDSAGGSPHTITCPSASVCFVVTYSEAPQTGLQNDAGPIPSTTSGEVTRDEGATWQTLGLPSGLLLNTAFSCPTPTTCMVGAIRSTSDTGPGSGSDSGPRIQLLLTTTDGGATWTEQMVPIPADPGPDPALLTPSLGGLWSQLECFDASTCLAFGTTPYGLGMLGGPGTAVRQTVVMRTDDGGRTWATHDLPWEPTPSGAPAGSNAQPATFSCTSPQACIGLATVLGAPTGSGPQAASSLEWRTSDGGATWTDTWVPQPTLTLGWHAMTCADATNCLAIGATPDTVPISFVLLRTDDGGGTWQSVSLPASSIDAIRSVSCNTINDCWVAGSSGQGADASGVILATTDGGTTWATQPIPPGVQSVDGLACPSVNACYAVATMSGTQGETELLTDTAQSVSR